MRKNIRFAGIIITNPKRRRFLRLWLYIRRVEMYRLKHYLLGALYGITAHYILLVSFTLFTKLSTDVSLFISYVANYNIKFLYHKYIAFKDRSLERMPLEWIGYMSTAYINTKLTNQVKDFYNLDFFHTQLYTIIPTTLVMYLMARFVIFKRYKKTTLKSIK